jgi:hypothetical protein
VRLRRLVRGWGFGIGSEGLEWRLELMLGIEGVLFCVLGGRVMG